MKKYTLGLILILATLVSNNSFGQSNERMNVAISKPIIEASNMPKNEAVYLDIVMTESMSESTDIVNFINRDELDLIYKHRENGFKNLAISQGSAQLEGVEYVLESKVIKYSEGWKNYCHVVKEEFMEKGKKVTKTISDTCKHSSILVSFNMELELISVETGEVVSKRNITPSAWYYQEFISSPTVEDKRRMRISAYNEMRTCFNIIWRNNLLKILQPEIRVIDIASERKGKAQELFILGGHYASYPIGASFEVVKKYEEKIGDETITRNEKIGDAILEERFYKYSLCDVKDGKQEIFKALNDGEELYCIPGKMLKLESCGNYGARKNQQEKIKSTSKKITLEDKEKESSTKTQAKTETSKPKEIQIKAKNPSTTKKKEGGNR